jgi:hypothetical protein
MPKNCATVSEAKEEFEKEPMTSPRPGITTLGGCAGETNNAQNAIIES